MNRKNKRKPDGEKIFSIIASLAIIAALIVGVYSIVRSTSKPEDNNYIDLNLTDKETTKDDSDIQKAEIKTEPPTQRPTETEPVTEAPTKADEEAAITQTEAPQEVNAPVFSFGESSSLLWPVTGKVVLGYNMDSTIYFPTLDQYKCNPAVMISAEVGTQVLSAAPGMVEKVYNDNITGTTVEISIGNGYKLTYGQLADVTLQVSDTVEVGTVIGTVAEPSRYFEIEGSNVYFQLTLNDEPVDPMLYLIEE